VTFAAVILACVFGRTFADEAYVIALDEFQDTPLSSPSPSPPSPSLPSLPSPPSVAGSEHDPSSSAREKQAHVKKQAMREEQRQQHAKAKQDTRSKVIQASNVTGALAPTHDVAAAKVPSTTTSPDGELRRYSSSEQSSRSTSHIRNLTLSEPLERKPTRATSAGCPSGYQRVYVQNVDMCLPCPPGFASAHGQQCIACKKGFMSVSSGSASCLPCTDGEISGIASSQCLLCPSGSVAAKNGTVCIPCPPGMYSIAGDIKCTPCERGTFNALSGQAGCVACGPGFYNTERGSTSSKSCHLCPYGASCPDASTVAPMPCDELHFSSAVGERFCMPCARMFYSVSTRDACTPTLAFYILVIGVILLLGLVVLCLVQCPKKEWGMVESRKDDFDPVL
jgi:Tyrosine-protein kinase ephrin type A/B receptor-like